MYSLRTIKKRAEKIGYEVSKGLSHYMFSDCPIFTFADTGERCTGYDVKDLTTGFYVWGCYNNIRDHLWSLEDVDNFLQKEYKRLGLEY